MNDSCRLTFYGHVERPYDAVRQLLRSSAQLLVQRATKAARGPVVARLWLEGAGVDVGVDVRVHVALRPDDPAQRGLPTVTHLALSWGAADGAALFPSMSADLALSPMRLAETRVEFVGTYEPPPGAVGRAVDAVVEHRIADVAVHHFVSDVLEQIRRELPILPDAGPPA
jgi:hypothetical protein